MGEGEFARIRHHLETARHASIAWWGDHDVCATLADVATMQGDAAALRQYAPLAEELAVRHGHVLYQAIAHRAWGAAHRLAGEYTEAAARLNRALDLFSESGARWQIGRTLFALGELAVDRNQPAEARDFFTRALAAFEEMRAAPDIARTRAVLSSGSWRLAVGSSLADENAATDSNG